jgi:membrane associated rhomboid family serine protease
MGIQDRDYYRESTGGFLDAWGRQGVTVWVIVITCVVFFAQCVGGPPQRSELVATGAFFTPAILSGEVWRLVTPLFLHADFWHLFVNMFVLYWVGSRLEEMHGGWEFLAFYLCAGVFANAIAFGLEASGIAPLTLGIGASGAVTAAFVVYAFNFPRQTVLLFFVLPMPMWVALILYIAIDTMGAMGIGRPGIGYIVHLGGALFGTVYYQTGFRFGRMFTRKPRTAGQRARPQLRVVPVEREDDTPTPVGAAVESQPRPKEAGEPKEPADEQFEARVDAVLEKVSKYGQESLTPEEREILFKASELYKKRRK